MALYPPQLTNEEKNLKQRYSRLLEMRKRLHKANEKAAQQAAPKSNHKDVLNPKDAKESAKKLLTAGKLSLVKKSPGKRSGFKKVGQLPGQAPNKMPSTAPDPVTPPPPPKPKVKASDQKALYSKFVRGANLSEELAYGDFHKKQQQRVCKLSDWHLSSGGEKEDYIKCELIGERIPRKQPNSEPTSGNRDEKKFGSKECTVHVHCHQAGIGELALRLAFKRFGSIETLTLDHSCNSTFITYSSPSIAATAMKELLKELASMAYHHPMETFEKMDKGMIHGTDVSVEPASTENGYVELPPEAASNPWSQIAAGRELKDSPMKKLDSHKHKHKIISYDEPDF